jgi:hypothetical protein
MDVLESILTLDFNVVVPGHGPVGSRESIVRMQEYLSSVERAAELALEGGDVDTIRIDSTFSDWMLAERFAENVRFVMNLRRDP